MIQPTFIEVLANFKSTGEGTHFDRYLQRPIPHNLDLQVEQFISAFLLAPFTEQAFLNSLPQGCADALLVFGERGAALAVRTQSQEHIERSVLAIGLAREIPIDDREVMLVLPLPWHAAERIGANPMELFKQAAKLLPLKGSKLLLDFCNRRPDAQTLQCMGYTTGSDKEGFRYVRTW